MSDEEIRREYRLAKYPAKQIRILADENSCDVKTIRRIVAGEGKTDLSTGFADPPPLKGRPGQEEENDMNMRDVTPTVPTADPEWPPLPAAPPQAAADFPAEADDLGPSSLPDVQDLPHGVGVVFGVQTPRQVERRIFLTEAQLMELWFILGQLRGVLDAAAEAGKPGEVMKDAVAELESLLRSLS